jgi:hypothetical protein
LPFRPTSIHCHFVQRPPITILSNNRHRFIQWLSSFHLTIVVILFDNHRCSIQRLSLFGSFLSTRPLSFVVVHPYRRIVFFKS